MISEKKERLLGSSGSSNTGREKKKNAAQTILKLRSVISRFQRLMRRSSADRYVSSSLLTEMELMWNADIKAALD
ncbi:hypothetical protein EYF80_041068 [Liparis tanakae]|uniref:Uncharacterized protein n=1 Tax=Liparis tanakae TaxID=230148 RepID=A0A4Z2G6C7_9TELE|nr:hypothetical protein EYF80_041068 [Liparis tanakae]